MTNGVRAHLRSMDYKKDTILLNINLAGGQIMETKDNKGITSLASLAAGSSTVAGTCFGLVRSGW